MEDNDGHQTPQLPRDDDDECDESEDDDDLHPDDKLCDRNNTNIFIRKITVSRTTKLGKRKKTHMGVQLEACMHILFKAST